MKTKCIYLTTLSLITVYFANSQDFTNDVNVTSSAGAEVNLLNTSSNIEWQIVSGYNGGFEIGNVTDGFTDGSAPFFITQNGNVGIGKTNPNSSLHISSSTIPESSTSVHDANLLIQGTGNRDLNTGVVLGFSLPANVDGSGPWQHGRIMVSPDNPNNARADGKMLLQTRYYTGSVWDWRDNLVLKSSGEVGIGTTNPDEKLTVKGTIHSEEVRVDLNVPAPDYVFEPDYSLRSLKDTETYINKNKHLPEIPSAKQMEANGVELGDMNMLLLKKIEELTLYTIAQEKLLTTQTAQLNEQKQSFETQLSQQQQLIEKLIRRIETLEKQ